MSSRSVSRTMRKSFIRKIAIDSTRNVLEILIFRCVLQKCRFFGFLPRWWSKNGVETLSSSRTCLDIIFELLTQQWIPRYTVRGRFFKIDVSANWSCHPQAKKVNISVSHLYDDQTKVSKRRVLDRTWLEVIFEILYPGARNVFEHWRFDAFISSPSVQWLLYEGVETSKR